MSAAKSDKFTAVLAEIDRRNGKDPNREDVNGQLVARELFYSQRRMDWVERLTDQPSEELLLATRAQHLGRWHWPRQNYPNGREGYLQWREYLKKYHAETLAEIMQAGGYGEESVNRACDLILKKNLSKNPEGQTFQDAVCLVFLEYELSQLSARIGKEKVRDILRKTWRKMSPPGRKIAMTLKLGETEERLIKSCLAGD